MVGLDGRMETLDGRMETLDGRVEGLGGRMDGLDGSGAVAGRNGTGRLREAGRG